MKKVVLVFLFLLLVSLVSAFSVGKFTILGTNYCGDNTVREKEECDGSNFGNKTCLSFGYSSGILNCTSECTFDESNCVFVPSSGTGVDGETEIIRECNDGIDNDGDGLIDSEDLGCSNVLDNSEKDSICDSEWVEGGWGECVEDVEVRYITDLNHCKSNYLQNETRSCFDVEIVSSQNYFYSFVSFVSILIGAYFLGKIFERRKER